MKRYGIARPLLVTGVAFAKSGLRVLRSVYQQRQLRVGKNVIVAHDVSIFGGGEVLLGDNAVLGQGVVLRIEDGASIEIGASAYIGANSLLEVRRGQLLKFGNGAEIGVRCQIIGEHSVLFGELSSLGADSIVGPREPDARGTLVVGRECHLHQHNFLDLCADITIGDHVRTGPFCTFYTHNHEPKPGKLVWDQSPIFAAITVESGTWIGHGCCVMPGVSIGHNSTMAAGAVVTRSVEPWTISGGVPARVIKTIAS